MLCCFFAGGQLNSVTCQSPKSTLDVSTLCSHFIILHSYYGLNVCVSQKLICWSPNVIVFGAGAFGVPPPLSGGQSSHDRIYVFVRRGKELAVSLTLRILRRRGPSINPHQEPYHAGPQTIEPWEINVCCWRHPIYGVLLQQLEWRLWRTLKPYLPEPLTTLEYDMHISFMQDTFLSNFLLFEEPT